MRLRPQFLSGQKFELILHLHVPDTYLSTLTSRLNCTGSILIMPVIRCLKFKLVPNGMLKHFGQTIGKNFKFRNLIEEK
jgi:hypothetical protein